jgi:hypothetical protein
MDVNDEIPEQEQPTSEPTFTRSLSEVQHYQLERLLRNFVIKQIKRELTKHIDNEKRKLQFLLYLQTYFWPFSIFIYFVLVLNTKKFQINYMYQSTVN